MDVLIIEDELPARAKLKAMLADIRSDIHVVAEIGSVADCVRWLASNPAPDIAFVDILLSDDHSFEIFRRVPVSFPVIFTTAFDKYLLESFEFNSVDYLLKPITEEKLRRSLEKIQKLEQHFVQTNIQRLIDRDKSTVQRIVGKKGIEFIALAVDDIAYFFTEHKLVFVRDFQGRQLTVDKTIAELETMLNKEQFYRVNRKFIANREAIEKFKPDNGKILVTLKPAVNEEVHVSKETAPDFRRWIGN